MAVANGKSSQFSAVFRVTLLLQEYSVIKRVKLRHRFEINIVIG